MPPIHTKASITLEAFSRLSMKDQVAHIDIKKTPSYPLWHRATLAAAKRADKKHNHGEPYYANKFMDSTPDLNTIGYSFWKYQGTSSEAKYAMQVCNELGITPYVNQGKFKGCEFKAVDLYEMLSEK